MEGKFSTLGNIPHLLHFKVSNYKLQSGTPKLKKKGGTKGGTNEKGDQDKTGDLGRKEEEKEGPKPEKGSLGDLWVQCKLPFFFHLGLRSFWLLYIFKRRISVYPYIRIFQEKYIRILLSREVYPFSYFCEAYTKISCVCRGITTNVWNAQWTSAVPNDCRYHNHFSISVISDILCSLFDIRGTLYTAFFLRCIVQFHSCAVCTI